MTLMHKNLLSKGADLKLQKALDILLSLESAIKQPAVMQGELKNTIESGATID